MNGQDDATPDGGSGGIWHALGLAGCAGPARQTAQPAGQAATATTGPARRGRRSGSATTISAAGTSTSPAPAFGYAPPRGTRRDGSGFGTPGGGFGAPGLGDPRHGGSG
jgi:hypothetical protein